MQKSKNILIVTYNDYPVFEGLGVRIKNVARMLQEDGHQITIFAPNIDRKQPATEELAGIRIVRCTIFVPAFLKKNRVLARAWSMVAQTLLTPLIYRKRLRKAAPAVILAEHIYAIPPAIVVKWFSRGILIVDDIITVSDALREAGFSRIVTLFTRFEKFLFRFCQEFMHTSPVSLQYYRDRGAHSTLYVPNGVDCAEFKPGQPATDKTVILFNGSTYSTQNTEAAVNFIEIGKKMVLSGWENLEFKLVCWPEYNLPEAVRQAIQTEKRWLSYQEGVEDIAAEIAAATITLLPYSRGHHLTGGVRLKALEYLACGKPIIATPEGVEGITGLVPGVHYREAGSIETFPEMIAELLRAPNELSALSQRAREFAQSQYDWRETTAVLRDFLRR
jgi:glycosyltransferase involved in cell wall biosynthesis